MKNLQLSIFRSCLRLALAAVLVLVSGCDDELAPIDPTKAQLQVYVYGSLSGNPRASIEVSIHDSEADAERGKNPVTDKRYTDNYGMVQFRNLEPGVRYWIRAKPLIGDNVEQTDVLVVGDNYHAIDII